MSNTPYDVLIIGSGPSGVSAALPLLEAGLSVAMLDGNDATSADAVLPADYMEARLGGPCDWLAPIGDRQANGQTSPKLRMPQLAHYFSSWQQHYRAQTQEFTAVGSLATGGLSNVWGAGVVEYNAEDIASWPFTYDELAESYRIVARRMGISGRGDGCPIHALVDEEGQPPVTPGANAALLLRNAARRAHPHFTLHHARNAVLTQPHEGRPAYTDDGMCLWQAGDAIWNARHELAKLKRLGLTHLPGARVTRISREGAHWQAHSLRGSFSGKQLVMAAGAIGSAALVLSSLGGQGQVLPLLSNPRAMFMLWLPRHLGRPFTREFGLVQLNYELTAPAYGFGGLVAAHYLPYSDYLAASGMGHRFGAQILRELVTSCMLGNCFFDGSGTSHRLMVDDHGTVHITGGMSAEFATQQAAIGRALRRYFLRLGALVVPGSLRWGAPGSDIHYAGLLPMQSHPGPWQTDASGQLFGHDGLYIVDGAALPSLPAKHLTLTLMANAHRIGRRMAHR